MYVYIYTLIITSLCIYIYIYIYIYTHLRHAGPGLVGVSGRRPVAARPAPIIMCICNEGTTTNINVLIMKVLLLI